MKNKLAYYSLLAGIIFVSSLVFIKYQSSSRISKNQNMVEVNNSDELPKTSPTPSTVETTNWLEDYTKTSSQLPFDIDLACQKIGIDKNIVEVEMDAYRLVVPNMGIVRVYSDNSYFAGNAGGQYYLYQNDLSKYLKSNDIEISISDTSHGTYLSENSTPFFIDNQKNISPTVDMTLYVEYVPNDHKITTNHPRLRPIINKYIDKSNGSITGDKYPTMLKDLYSTIEELPEYKKIINDTYLVLNCFQSKVL